MDTLLVFHRVLWAVCFGLSWLAVCCGFTFLLTGNPRTWRGLKMCGVGAITLAFLATWL